jgi:predicted Zn finger-like uncharacterized protein
MIILCEGCDAKYFLPEEKVPSRPTRVRCPHCRAVFTLEPVKENVVAATQESVVSSPPKSAPAQASAPRPSAPPSVEPKARPRSASAKPANADEARARRLARVLVSDILCYNQEKRDQALVDGNLITMLGDEIKKSWELYKEKVGPDLAKSTNYFKEALNEILADGQKVF